MVTVISGGNNSERDEIFLEKIRNSCERKDNILVIVPDQFSFEFDKILYKFLGAEKFNSIKTAGINRICEIIADTYGSQPGENADDNVKTILMFKAISRFKKENVRFYKKSLDKANFISEMNSLLSKLRESGITPEQLTAAAENTNGPLSLKLFDISEIYRLYLEELKNAGMKDSVTALAASVRIAAEKGFFKGLNVFVTSFTDFSYDELRLVETCISQCENFCISLPVDDKSVEDFANHPFGIPVKTRSEIERISKHCGKKTEKITCENYRYNSPEIEFFARKIFNFKREKFNGSTENTVIMNASDIYEETEYICSEICRLVNEKTCDYGDIVVFARNINECRGIFRGIFERYDIPYFIDCEAKVSTSTMAGYFNALFKCVLTKKYKTENILKLIKSPLFSAMDFDVNALEEYCIKWNVNGDMWKSDFTAGKSNSQEEKALERINNLRKRVISPLEDFRSSCENAGAREICRALYNLLDKFELSKQTYSAVKRASTFDNESNLELSRNLKQLWTMTLGTIKSMYDVLGEEKISLRKFSELFNLCLSQKTLSNPPQRQNSVTIADPSASRTANAKVVFVCELNEEIFPAKVSSSGLITNKESEALKNLPEEIKIEISADVMKSFMSEKFAAYAAVSLPTHRLYLTYSQSDLTGKEKRPSLIIKEAKEILGIDELSVRKLDLDFFCTSFKTAYYKYLEHSGDRSTQSMSVLRALNKNKEYSSKLKNLGMIKENGDFKIQEETSEKLFFKGDEIYISPSGLEKYFQCPFAFFCNYGLKISKPGKMEINSLNRGNIVHEVLEKMLFDYDDTIKMNVYDSNFTKMTDEKIKEKISLILNEYYNQQLGGDFGKTNQFKFVFSQLEKYCFRVVKFVQAEQNQSSFEPKLAEYKFNKEENKSRLEIVLEDGKKIVVTGKIDRADIFKGEDGKTYVRVVDYKTGTRKLNLGLLYNGLNLQMFVYLAALLESNNPLKDSGEIQPAGVVYYTFGEKYEKKNLLFENTDDENQLEQRAKSERLKMFKPKGEAADVSQVIESFGCDRDYAYTPFSEKDVKDRKNTIYNPEDFEVLEECAMKKSEECGRAIEKGRFDAYPAEGTCSYCDYKEICGNAFPKDAKKTNSKMTFEEVLEYVRPESGNQLDSGSAESN